MTYIDATLAEDAITLTSTSRHDTYGHPAQDFNRAAQIWTAILGHPVTARDVALCMVGIKLARLHHTPGHRDSVVDAIGYLLTYRACTEHDKLALYPDIP